MKVLLSILKKILAVVTVLAIVCGVIVGYNVTWLNKTFITTFYSVETDKDISDLRIVNCPTCTCTNMAPRMPSWLNAFAI